MSNRTRISKKLLATLPADVAETVNALVEDYGFKSLSFSNQPQGYRVYNAEGDKITMIYAGKSKSIETVGEHNLGAAGLNHDINGSVVPPSGTWICRVWYYGAYYLDLINITQPALNG